MFNKLYGRAKDQEALASILDDLQDDLKKVERAVSAEDKKLLDEHATFVREMEQELKGTKEANVGHTVPEIEPGVKERERQYPENQQDADRVDGQQFRPPTSPAWRRCSSPTPSAGRACTGSASARGTTHFRTSRTRTRRPWTS